MQHDGTRQTLRRTVLTFFVSIVCGGGIGGVGGSAAHAGEILYTYISGDHGGLARIVTCDESGRVLTHERLVEDVRLGAAQKLALDPHTHVVAIVNSAERDAGVMLFPLSTAATDEGGRGTFVPLPSMPDAVAAHGGFAYVGCDNGTIVSIDLRGARIAGTFNSREMLTPPGQKPESMALVPARGLLLASFQKDHAGGKRLGNRVVALDLATLALIADVQLPRSKPGLHNPSNRKEQGPGPEVVLVDDEASRVLVTIDLYGAVIIAELESVLSGSIGDSAYRSVAADGSFGTTFPDRGRLVPCPDRSSAKGRSGCALVANSGVAGGIALFEMDRGERIGFVDAPPGIELSEPLTDGRVFGAHGGKIKERGEDEVQKRYEPRALLTEIRMAGDSIELTDHAAPGVTHNLIKADPEGKVMLVVIGDDRKSIALFDTTTKRFLPERAIDGFGAIQRLIGP